MMLTKTVAAALFPGAPYVAGITSALLCAAIVMLVCFLSGRSWKRRAILSKLTATGNEPEVADISCVAAHERWTLLLLRAQGYVVLAPFVVAAVCWVEENRGGMWLSLVASVPVVWAASAVRQHSLIVAWAFVGVWAASCATMAGLASSEAKNMSDFFICLFAGCVFPSLLCAPLLVWSWRALMLWHLDFPAGRAFRAVKAHIETEKNLLARDERERKRWSAEKNSGKITVLSGAAAAQSLLGFASLLTGTSVIHHLLSQTADATRHRALRLGAESGSAMLEKDADAPVLYLRSFADDGLYFSSWSVANRVSWEQPVVEAGLMVGPVIAIGQPGEGLAQLGAARDYLSDDEWQAHAQQWMEVSQAIILVIGRTSGLAWEASQLLTRQLLAKTVLVMPPLPDAEMAQRWETFIAGQNHAGPFAELSKLDTRRTLAVIFDESGRGTSIWSRCRSKVSDFNWAVKAALGLMRSRNISAAAELNLEVIAEH